MASALMPSRIRINATTFAYPNLPGNPDSTQPKSALALATSQYSPQSAAPGDVIVARTHATYCSFGFFKTKTLSPAPFT
jgi:hypothetical protein